MFAQQARLRTRATGHEEFVVNRSAVFALAATGGVMLGLIVYAIAIAGLAAGNRPSDHIVATAPAKPGRGLASGGTLSANRAPQSSESYASDGGPLEQQHEQVLTGNIGEGQMDSATRDSKASQAPHGTMLMELSTETGTTTNATRDLERPSERTEPLRWENLAKAELLRDLGANTTDLDLYSIIAPRLNSILQAEQRKWVLEELEFDLTSVIASRLSSATQAELKKVLDKAVTLDRETVQASLPGLPFREGRECEIEESVTCMSQISNTIRAILMPPMTNRAHNTDSELTPEERRRTRIAIAMLTMATSHCEDAIPTLVQMLQVEEEPVRLKLVRLLTEIDCTRSSLALAGRAVFDLSADVRDSANQALARRPKQQYRAFLLNTLRYPWPAAAEHAARTLVAVHDEDSIDRLIEFLGQPDPRAPYRDAQGHWLVREVARVNHLRNCSLCHASVTQAARSETFVASIPMPGMPISPSQGGYGSRSGPLVRADIVYLQQDFSIMETVNSGHADPWPKEQRFDYFVRTLEIDALESANRLARFTLPDNSPYRKATLLALRELTGTNPGDTAAAWRRWREQIARN